MLTHRTVAGSTASPHQPLTLTSLSDATIGPLTLATARPTLLGRQSQCDLQLADQTVSRVHAVIERTKGTWYVTDKASRLGTLLNGVRLQAEQPTELRGGDVLSIAHWSFRVHEGEVSKSVSTATIAGSSRLTEGDRGRVETFKSDALLSRAEQRLQLVLELSGSMHAATDEAMLAAAVVAAAAKGSNYERCAVMKVIPGTDMVTVLAATVNGARAPDGFTFSRSLVRAAAAGEVARLTASDAVIREAASIISQGIRSATCAPITIGADVAAFLYVDTASSAPTTSGDVEAFIAAIAHIASLALAELSRRQLEKRHHQLETDLAAARLAQMQLMPAASGSFGGFSYATRNTPGRLVAGDLIDVIDLGHGRVAACLGDVAGKGVGAAMLMAAAQTQLRSTLRHETDLALAINQLNREVVTRLLTEGFISLWVGVLDANRGTLTYVDAGHSYWAFRRSGDRHAAGPTAECMPLGVDAGEIYRATTLPFGPGDRVTIYSDGVVEQLSPSGTQFRTEGIIEALDSSTDEHSDVTGLFEALSRFAATDAFADDVSILSLRR